LGILGGTMSDFIQPLDLEQILVNLFAGSWNIFIFLSIITIGVLAARFRMPNLIFLAMLGIFSVFLSQYLGGLYAMVIIITGMLIFYIVGRFRSSF